MSGLLAVLAASLVVSPVESNELEIARSALRDGIWQVAREHAYRSGTNELAKLVVLESLAGENRWDEITKRLGEWQGDVGAGFDYYRAVTRGDHDTARRLLSEGGSPEGLAVAQLYEAEVLASAGDRKGAEALWLRVAANTNAGERAMAVASINLGDVARLRAAYSAVKSVRLRRRVGLKLGLVLLGKPETFDEGVKLVRAIAVESPDAEGTMNAFLEMANGLIGARRWKEALDAYREAASIWPMAAKLGHVNEGIGWALLNSGDASAALTSFGLAREGATNDLAKATATIKEGDALTELNRIDEAMAKYREAMAKCPKLEVVKNLAEVVKVRELESKGRGFYREYRFEDARRLFAEVAKADSARSPRMKFYMALCLYGQGRDEEARGEIAALGGLQAKLWLAKYAYNCRDWKEAKRCFKEYASEEKNADSAAMALAWAARAACSAGEYDEAIGLATEVQEKYPDCAARSVSLVVQGEILIEQTRYDEAELVLERALTAQLSAEDRHRATLLRADVLYALGADNPRRYEAAREVYASILASGTLSESDGLVSSFKLARTLEKLQRNDEAIDLYYVKVVLAYRQGRARGVHYNDDARAIFSRAAIRLADEYESQGKERQARDILELLSDSDVPAAEEARKRIERIDSKGRFL